MAEAAAKAKKTTAKTKAATATAQKGQLKITQTRSPAGRLDHQAATLKGLGLRRIRDSKILNDTPEVRGMIRAVHHLVQVEEVKN